MQIAHKLALREQYRYAFKIGKAERTLEHVRKFAEILSKKDSERVLEENESAYNLARKESNKKV